MKTHQNGVFEKKIDCFHKWEMINDKLQWINKKYCLNYFQK